MWTLEYEDVGSTFAQLIKVGYWLSGRLKRTRISIAFLQLPK